MFIPNSRLIWTRQDEVDDAASTKGHESRCKRAVLGFGGQVEDCGALRLTDEGDESPGQDCKCTPAKAEELPNISASIQGDSAVGGRTKQASPVATLFDADFDMTFDAKSGRWMVSNVNVLKRTAP